MDPPQGGDGVGSLPIFNISGYSGSGKTTLIEKLIPIMTRRGLRVAVIKHDCHGLSLDREGKDSDRFFKAGADVVAQGPEQACHRVHAGTDSDLFDILRKLINRYDIIFVEGHKTTPLPNKIWLRGENEEESPPPETGKLELVLSREADRVKVITRFIDEWFDGPNGLPPLYAGILIGGNSTRMGCPKHLIEKGNSTWIESIVGTVAPLVDTTVILGRGQVPPSLAESPVLPDVPHRRGPVAGMLSAMRWQPLAAWVFVACDLPMVTAEAVQWLLGNRKPGVWAILPSRQNEKGAEPLLAYYDFRARDYLEKVDRPTAMANSPKAITPAPPENLAASWTNINTPGDTSLLPD